MAKGRVVQIGQSLLPLQAVIQRELVTSLRRWRPFALMVLLVVLAMTLAGLA